MGQVFSFFFTFLRVQLFAKLPDTHADLTGRTFLVTGSNTGLGLALAIHLARLNPALLILAVRDLKKGDAAKETVIAETGFKGPIEVWELDMADFASVRRFAERATTTLKRLDGAVLNAGINAWKWGLTGDGWEKTYVCCIFVGASKLSTLQLASQRACDRALGCFIVALASGNVETPTAASRRNPNPATSHFYWLRG
jgi:hypothetical protein